MRPLTDMEAGHRLILTVFLSIPHTPHPIPAFPDAHHLFGQQFQDEQTCTHKYMTPCPKVLHQSRIPTCENSTRARTRRGLYGAMQTRGTRPHGPLRPLNARQAMSHSPQQRLDRRDSVNSRQLTASPPDRHPCLTDHEPRVSMMIKGPDCDHDHRRSWIMNIVNIVNIVDEAETSAPSTSST